MIPPAIPFTSHERALIARLRTPQAVQRWLNMLPYNSEKDGETQRSFRQVVRTRKAHCMEAALGAAVILEQHGYPPLIMSIESIDLLDHVLFVYKSNGRWGSVARSRDPGLHGRKPVFSSPRALAMSYVDPYVDATGRVRGFAVVNVADEMGSYDWRLSEGGADGERGHRGGANVRQSEPEGHRLRRRRPCPQGAAKPIDRGNGHIERQPDYRRTNWHDLVRPLWLVEVAELARKIEVVIEQRTAQLREIHDAIGGDAMGVRELLGEAKEQRGDQGVDVGGGAHEREPWRGTSSSRQV